MIGILWMVSSIPVVSAGGAATAAYYAVSKSVRHKTGYFWKEFVHSFKGNFKQSAVLSLIWEVVFVILGMDLWYVWSNENKVNNGIFMILLLILFLAAGIWIYLWPLLSRFEKKNLELVKMAVVVMFRYLPITIGLLLLAAVLCMGIYVMPWAILVIPGVYQYILSFPMEWILKKLMPVPEEGSAEAEKWYYQ